jgi:hypothetical protein
MCIIKTTKWLTILAAIYIINNSCIDTSNKNSITIDDDIHPTEFASDEEFLTFIQKQHFNYMWDGAESHSGMAPERIHIDGIYPENDQEVVTTGGTGFGLMSIIVGMDRDFISREDGVNRLDKIVGFLETADRFNGIWPHWLYGSAGKVKPFSQKDNGGDLVESAFLVQGLLTVHQYLNPLLDNEIVLRNRIDSLWRGMNWEFYTNSQDVLFWHWSPEYKWEMNHQIRGYDECLITYILAAASPTHPIKTDVYHKGWARNGEFTSQEEAFGYPLILKHNGAEAMGGPLFWSHYSYLGLDPNGLQDKYANYWQLNTNHAKINHLYCSANPNGFKAYGDSCWGLTASYSIKGYSAHQPNNDLGVISPTAALSSFPYTPNESMKALKYFYFTVGNKIWGEYGFYDAFSEEFDWYIERYLAIDQNTITPMIENHRTGLLWRLFMSHPDVQNGLTRLGFTSPHL